MSENKKTNKETLIEAGYTEKHLETIRNEIPDIPEEEAYLAEIEEWKE